MSGIIYCSSIPDYTLRMRVKWAVLFFLLVSLVFSACGLLDNSSGMEDAADDDLEMATPESTTEVPQKTPVFEVPATVTPAAVALNVWISSQIAVRSEAGMQTMADQMTAYNARNPDVDIRVEQKRVLGEGGILSYLRTGRSVAPTILPDLIAIPADLLPTATNESLIYPLDDRVDPDLLETLFPPALEMVRADERTMGFPFALTWLPHLVYNNNVLIKTLPLTWERLISEPEHRMVIAADGTDGALLALQFYLDAGGAVENELGQPALQVEPLAIALGALQEGRENGFLIPQSSSLSTLDQSWQLFLGGSANIVHTTSGLFLSKDTSGLPIEITVAPGIDRPLTPLVGGWAWAISTSDPSRQAAAYALMLDLIAAPNQGEWSQKSRILPARRDSLALWTGGDLYVGFAQQELERAQSLPVALNSNIMTVLSDAVFQVVSGSKLAQEAAEDAAAALES